MLGLFVLIFGMFGFVSCQRKTPQQKADYVVKKVSSRLDLNEAQELKLEKIKVKALAIHARNKSTKEEMFGKVKGMILSDKLDEGEVKDLMSQRRQLIDEVVPEVLPDIIDFHASLNAEQKKDVVKFMDKIKKRHGHK